MSRLVGPSVLPVSSRLGSAIATATAMAAGDRPISRLSPGLSGDPEHAAGFAARLAG